jgi:hypothetical protein
MYMKAFYHDRPPSNPQTRWETSNPNTHPARYTKPPHWRCVCLPAYHTHSHILSHTHTHTLRL